MQLFLRQAIGAVLSLIIVTQPVYGQVTVVTTENSANPGNNVVTVTTPKATVVNSTNNGGLRSDLSNGSLPGDLNNGGLQSDVPDSSATGRTSNAESSNSPAQPN